jgi:hypothetical protein
VNGSMKSNQASRGCSKGPRRRFSVSGRMNSRGVGVKCAGHVSQTYDNPAVGQLEPVWVHVSHASLFADSGQWMSRERSQCSTLHARSGMATLLTLSESCD